MAPPSPDRCESAVLAFGRGGLPLPVRAAQGTALAHARPREAPGPPQRASFPPFDFSAQMRALCEDIVARCDAFAHVRVSQILIGFHQARNARVHGLQARVTPLRFRNGLLQTREQGREYQVQRITVDGREMLYLLSFCLPRFLDQTFEEKLITLFHELYHISPRFDGDLRRHTGRYNLHTRSQKSFDLRMAQLARTYLAQRPDPRLHNFLRLKFAMLRERYGQVVGVVVPRPRIVPRMDQSAEAGD